MLSLKSTRGPQHLEILARQQFIVGTINCVAAHLDGVLRGAHDRGADALASRRQGPSESAAID